jgi:hypothetical protein
MGQSRWYGPLLLSGLTLPFLAGYFSNGWIGGVCCFMRAGVGEDLSGPELHVLHQFRLSAVGKSTLQSVQFQLGQWVGVAHHAGRGIP